MDDFPLITTIAAGFTAAWVLGLLSQWLRFSPIVGYLLAGVLIGPYTPGFEGNLHLAHQLANVGVILLMFGVGLQFRLRDLLAVRSVALPGALVQSLAATLFGIAVFTSLGMEFKTSAILGMAMAVASTVVLMRVLIDADALGTPAGHVAVGWLLAEDVLTVFVLVLIPVLGGSGASAMGAGLTEHPAVAVALAFLKLAALIAIVLFAGPRVIPWTLMQVTRFRSHELFTLTIMVFSVAIAAGAYIVFGASMALGAFLAGMMVAQSPVSHQAAADALPLRDAFAVLFFVAVGMLFDPFVVLRAPFMLLAVMGIILIVKPLAALLIVALLGHSVHTSLTVALGLAQIGEFSFILSDVAHQHHLITEEANNLLVGGAILSIALNPFLFRSLPSIEAWLRRHPRLWNALNSRAERKVTQANLAAAQRIAEQDTNNRPRAVVIGFGPVGRSVNQLLSDAGLDTVVVDTNMDTILELERQGQTAIFGDASREGILAAAGVAQASHLVLTLPQTLDRVAIVSAARIMNPSLKIFVRARYLSERKELEQAGATGAIFEEAEAAVALSRLVLIYAGKGREMIEHAAREIRMRLIMDNVSVLRNRPIRNVMVPWTRVRRLLSTDSLDNVRRQLGAQHFTRWPVVEAQSGRLMGVLLARDLIGFQSDGTPWTDLVQRLECAGPDDSIETALTYFHQKDATICAVKDRDIPLGIVTVEDILELVIGKTEGEHPQNGLRDGYDLIITDGGLLELECDTSEQAVAEMAKRIPLPCLPERTNIAERAIARAREVPTSIGMGVAIPHAHCENLARPFIVFGRSRPGIAWESHSTERVHLIFLLVVPSDRQSLQVHLLEQVASIAADPERRQRLQDAASLSEVDDILAETKLRISAR